MYIHVLLCTYVCVGEGVHVCVHLCKHISTLVILTTSSHPHCVWIQSEFSEGPSQGRRQHWGKALAPSSMALRHRPSTPCSSQFWDSQADPPSPPLAWKLLRAGTTCSWRGGKMHQARHICAEFCSIANSCASLGKHRETSGSLVYSALK